VNVRRNFCADYINCVLTTGIVRYYDIDKRKEMVDMNRITPEQVVEAYKETGLKPRQRVFLVDKCACGLGVLAAHDANINNSYDAYDWAVTQYGEDYVESFWRGFDDRSTTPQYEQHIGYEDGRACWQAVVEAGLVEE
jgi:hypothetical protein